MTEDKDHVERSFCDERHQHTMRLLEKIDRNLETLTTRLNWFYVTAVVTAATAVLAAIGLKG